MSEPVLTVTKATDEDCISVIFKEPRLLKLYKPYGVTDEASLLAYIHSIPAKYYIVKYADYSMIFTLEEMKYRTGAYEYHVACPRRSVLASRVLILTSLHWIFNKDLKVTVLVSDCPEGVIANTARKAGAIEIANINKHVYFIMTTNQFRGKL